MRSKFYVWFYRLVLNCMPCIWGGGGKVIVLTPDFRRLVVRLRLKIRTMNIMGTIFGGSMYASTDPMFMIMLMEILGKDYVVWDKGCTIRFKRPAKKNIFCEFLITDEMLEKVKSDVARDNETTFTWAVAYKNKDGVVYCEFDKVLYVAAKSFYEKKLAARRTKNS